MAHENGNLLIDYINNRKRCSILLSTILPHGKPHLPMPTLSTPDHTQSPPARFTPYPLLLDLIRISRRSLAAQPMTSLALAPRGLANHNPPPSPPLAPRDRHPWLPASPTPPKHRFRYHAMQCAVPRAMPEGAGKSGGARGPEPPGPVKNPPRHWPIVPAYPPPRLARQSPSGTTTVSEPTRALSIIRFFPPAVCTPALVQWFQSRKFHQSH